MKNGIGFIALGTAFVGLVMFSSCTMSPTAPAPTPTPVPPTSTPCMNSSQTPCTSTPTDSPTDTPTLTSTPTAIPTTCSIVGYNVPASSITPVAMNVNDYAGYFNAIYTSGGPGETIIGNFESLDVYAANSAGVTGNLEFAVYSQIPSLQLLSADSILQVPPGASQWFNVSLSASVTNLGAFYLVAHALSPNLSIGTVPATLPYMGEVNGNYNGTPLPASLSFTQSLSPPFYAIDTNLCLHDTYWGY